MNDIATREIEQIELQRYQAAHEAEEASEIRAQLDSIKALQEELRAKIEGDGMSIGQKVDCFCKLSKTIIDGNKEKFAIKKEDMRHVDDIKTRIFRTIMLGKRLFVTEAAYGKYVEGIEEIWSDL